MKLTLILSFTAEYISGYASFPAFLSFHVLTWHSFLWEAWSQYLSLCGLAFQNDILEKLLYLSGWCYCSRCFRAKEKTLTCWITCFQFCYSCSRVFKQGRICTSSLERATVVSLKTDTIFCGTFKDLLQVTELCSDSEASIKPTTSILYKIFFNTEEAYLWCNMIGIPRSIMHVIPVWGGCFESLMPSSKPCCKVACLLDFARAFVLPAGIGVIEGSIHGGWYRFHIVTVKKGEAFRYEWRGF